MRLERTLLSAVLLVLLVGLVPAAKPPLRVTSPKLDLELSQSGEITALVTRDPACRLPLSGSAAVRGMGTDFRVRTREVGRGGIEFRTSLGSTGSLVQRFLPRPDSIRWELEIRSGVPPWTAPVDSAIKWNQPQRPAFWTAWGGSKEWDDPLDPLPFSSRRFQYGGHFMRDKAIALPLATLLDTTHSLGLSFIAVPDKSLLDLDVSIGSDGSLVFTRLNHRFGRGQPVTVSMDIVAHKPDPRCALAWMVKNYPALFNPPNPRAFEIAGGGSYSKDEEIAGADRLRGLGYSFNWKASFDFPYMGMFLPPVDRTLEYARFPGNSSGSFTAKDEGRNGKTSIRNMAEYAARMRSAGFHVLNYFNVTEFGAGIKFPLRQRDPASTTPLWRDPEVYLSTAFPDALLRTPNPSMTWGGAVVTDCGDPRYRSFLLKQAKRHVDELPAADGICIDRLDWLSQYNRSADDGVSWVNGPARSLSLSWKQLMTHLGPLMHSSDKVIFVNPLLQRIDLMQQVDGFYDEFGHLPTCLNESSFLALRKPLVAWVPDEKTLQPDPDRFFQRYLYMGSFLTIPVKDNDHTITPSAWADEQYLAYVELFKALHGRRWILKAQLASTDTSGAKANAFEVPGGVVVPVIFGGNASRVRVTLRGIHAAGVRPEAVVPGVKTPRQLPIIRSDNPVVLEVPLVRGCAMVRLPGARP